MQEILEALRAYSDRLVKLNEADWQLFSSFASPISLKKSEFLLQAGEVCDHVCFIGKGLFRSFHVKDGEEITQTFFFAGNYVTEYESFLTRRPAATYIQAMEAAELVHIHYNDIQKLYANSPDGERMGRLIAENIFIGLSLRTRHFLMDTPEERYVALMKERPKVIEHIPLKYIASYLGIQPESLSRIRARMVRNAAG